MPNMTPGIFENGGLNLFLVFGIRLRIVMLVKLFAAPTNFGFQKLIFTVSSTDQHT
jgi:hypothetical protein